MPKHDLSQFRGSTFLHSAGTSVWITSIREFLHHQYQFLICLSLHFVIIVFHVVLIVIDFKHHQYLAPDTLANDVMYLATTMGSSQLFKVWTSHNISFDCVFTT